MYSVVQRVRNVRQPYKGYLPVEMFTYIQEDDYENVQKIRQNRKAVQGMVVDYLTRLMMKQPKEEAFSISLEGAELVGEKEIALDLLKHISGIDDESIRYACILVRYDEAKRRGIKYYRKINIEKGRSQIERKLINNIKILVNRSVRFLRDNGPVTGMGFTMEGGYNDVISSGDGDYLTQDTLWDLKTSGTLVTREHTLQLAVYYVMGVHSIHPEFQNIKRLGIYNPLENSTYIIKISNISDDIFSNICSEVIGYITPKEPKNWKKSYGTDEKTIRELYYQWLADNNLDTGFRTKNYKDGIYDITVDDYWTFFKKIADNRRPRFARTASVKFIKHKGYVMFLSVSPEGRLAIMHGGSLRKVNKPIEYYYEKLPIYANMIMKRFSPYWNVIFQIGKTIKTIEPSHDYLEKHLYAREYQSGETTKNYEKWYKERKKELYFSGKVHGCIVDLDWFNHLYLNPITGEIVPYYADSISDKFVYRDIGNLIRYRRPEMYSGYKELLISGKCNINFTDKKMKTLAAGNVVNTLSERKQEYEEDDNEDEEAYVKREKKRIKKKTRFQMA